MLPCRQLFADAMDSLPSGDRKPLSFAQPGKERQDSVFNGFQVAIATYRSNAVDPRVQLSAKFVPHDTASAVC
jgi:2-C-methyl-D-erythritol 4-phosphate cytidylyltransferase